MSGLEQTLRAFFVFAHGRSNLKGALPMTTNSGGETTEQKPAAERIEEARQLHRSINRTLTTVLDLIEQGEFEHVNLLPKQVTQLNGIVADLRKREAEFDAQFGTGMAEGDIDFDKLRREIGCRLGRIRRCCRA